MTVNDVMEIGKLKEGYIRAGAGGINNLVSSITIMDIPDIADWLRGGEMLISGILFQQCCTKEFIDKLITRNIPAIITKEKFANNVKTAIFDYCDKINFPIIIAPADCNWGEIMNPVISHIVKLPYKIIEESQRFHETLMKSMIEGVPLGDLCTQLYNSSNLSLAITDNDFHILGFSNNLQWKDFTRNLSKYSIQYSGYSYETLDDKKAYIYTYDNMLLKSLKLKIFIYPVTLNHIGYGYILVAIDENTKNQIPVDIMKIQQLGFIVALYSTKQNEINNATRRFNNLILDQLMQNDDLSPIEAENILSSVGKKIHRNYYMVQFKYDKKYNLESIISRSFKINKLHSLLEIYIPSYEHIIVFERGDAHIILIPDSTPNFEKLILQLKDIFISSLGAQNVYIGISEITAVNNLSKAFEQSEYSASFISQTSLNKPFFYYKDLGILKYFMNNKGDLNEDFLKEIYEKYITPLEEHDKTYSTELKKTLDIYFQCNRNKTITEKKLFIHKNTLRARIATINKILDCNIDSVEDSFNIILALKVQYFLNNKI